MIRQLPVPTTRPPRPGRRRTIVAFTTLGLAGLLAGLLTGCSGSNSSAVNTLASTKSYAAVAGNWKFTSGTSTGLTSVAGALAVSGTTVSGTLHPLVATCAKASETFDVTGSIDANGLLSITSSKFSGGALVVSGTLAADQHSLLDPAFTVTGGSCAAQSPAANAAAARLSTAPTAQQYQPLTGNYSGTFTDSSGAILPLTATLSQPTAPDGNGVYHLTGYATFGNNSCLNTPVITDSTVTGDTIQATYTDTATGNTVVGNGTFSPDAQTLTITDWTLTGCGNDTGVGLLQRQTN